MEDDHRKPEVGRDGVSDAVLEAGNLYRFFHAGDDETFALRGVSLRVAAGELAAVVGPSGSGKSTLMACLSGLDEPNGGSVTVGRERLTRRPEPVRARLRARWIGVLLQSGNLIEHLSVRQNVTLVRVLARGPAGPPDDLFDELGLADRADARPSTLSGGEAARAGLAVALANDPPVLLADEPTGEVDEANEEVVIDLLRARAASGTAVVVVTHSERFAAAADRVVDLIDGTARER
jgi:putative ABC transport system ATP-binding protein